MAVDEMSHYDHWCLDEGSGYFVINGILPLEAILPSLFKCDYVTIIATVLAVTLWCVDSAAALKCNGCRMESSVAGHLKKSSVHQRGPCMEMYRAVYTGRECTVGGECRLRVQIF